MNLGLGHSIFNHNVNLYPTVWSGGGTELVRWAIDVRNREWCLSLLECPSCPLVSMRRLTPKELNQKIRVRADLSKGSWSSAKFNIVLMTPHAHLIRNILRFPLISPAYPSSDVSLDSGISPVSSICRKYVRNVPSDSSQIVSFRIILIYIR